ncbi:PEFG-CTERM sorting domain-containing protein [Nitrosopumilus ureiphilus]|uniref:PEFG-CTERM domain-containing protein n=1 Tax=Nitrosopumilus ureiphilus TaxID=1470067 RepID=A0A7D5M5J0_9ARCH|nr:PEFG-CTERM sorting domain-containing protein [Nitrosopumilus ureiphilus]QLH07053.1 PEFG-CTERM domain-containing protein [Nitrosopumilus ureiphilus]
MLKIPLFLLFTISMVSTLAFAEPTIKVQTSDDEIKALESIWVTGKITDVSQYKPVKLRVIEPNGAIVFAPQVVIDDNGEFRKLLNPPIPSFDAGKYIVTASHDDTKAVAQTQFTVIFQEIPRNPTAQPHEPAGIVEKESNITRGISMLAEAENGSDIIKIKGNTSYRDTDITLVVKSPAGNLITIDQVTPGTQGDFEIEIKTGGSMWKEDGMYSITANQGASSEYNESIKVEIKDGVVIPEFGVVALLVLAISIISIIIVSAKSKLAIPSNINSRIHQNNHV